MPDRPIVYPAPLLSVETDELDFGVVRQPEPRSQSFTVSNIGGKGNLSVRMETTPPAQPWFTVEPHALEIAPGESRLVVVTLATAAKGCQPGTPNLSVRVESAESMFDKTARIEVTAEILPPLELVVEPPKFEYGKVALGESRSATFVVRKSDQQDVELEEDDIDLVDSTGQSRRPWVDLRCLPAGPAVAKTVEVTFHTANRKERERYDAKLVLRDRDPECHPAEVPVGITVAEPPRLEPRWTQPALPMFAGTQQEAVLTIGNVGAGLLRGSVRATRSWLSTGSSQFSLEAGEAKPIEIIVNARTLEVGAYEGELEIHSNDGGRQRVRRLGLELEVVAEDTCPIQVVWDRNMGSVPRGETVPRDLTVRNLLGNPFSGNLTVRGEEPTEKWLVPAQHPVDLAPGQERLFPLRAETQGLATRKGGVDHTTGLSVGSGDRSWWQGDAALTVMPPPRKRWKKICLGLLPLLLLPLLAGYLWFQFFRPHPEIPVLTALDEKTQEAAARLVSATMGPSLGDGLAAFAYLKPGEVVVVRGAYDHIEDVMKLLHIEAKVVNPLDTPNLNLQTVQAVLVNCPGELPEEALPGLRRFVEGGGYLFTTDWCLRYMIQRPAFGSVVAWTGGFTGTEFVDAQIVDKDNPLCEGVQPGGEPPRWAVWGSHPLRVLSPRVTTLLESDDMRRNYGAAPVAVTYGLGQGEILHITGHVNPPREGWPTSADSGSGMSFATRELGLRGRDLRPDRELLDGTKAGAVRDAYSIQKLCANFLRKKLFKDAKAHYEAGMEAWDAQDYGKCEEQLDLATKRRPDPTWEEGKRALFFLGCCHYKAERFTNAREAFKKVTTIDDKSTESWVWLGKSERQLGNTGEARKAYRRALKLDRNHPEAREELASLR